MKWNWIKIKSVKDVPDFDKPVLLYEKKDGKHYAMVGSLKSIDGKGFNWGLSSTTGMFDLNSIFGGFEIPSENKFKPTHWCEIQIPVDE